MKKNMAHFNAIRPKNIFYGCFLVVLCFFSAGHVQAQQWGISIHGAYIHANMQYEAGTYDETRDLSVAGWGTHLELQYLFGRHFSLIAAPGLAQRGTKCEPDYILPVGSAEVALTLNYIESPLLCRATFSLIPQRLQVFAEAGGNYAYAFSGYRNFYDDQNNRVGERLKATFNDWFGGVNKRTDYGILGGGGLRYKARSQFIQLTGRYYHGLPDLARAGTSKNRSLAISLGYGWTF